MPKTALAKKLIAAREKRGWKTPGTAVRHMRSVGRQTLVNLEGGKTANCATSGLTTRMQVALGIIEAYWPDVQLEDFVPDTRLKAIAKDGTARRRLRSQGVPEDEEDRPGGRHRQSPVRAAARIARRLDA